jgi:hypothetical protein
MNTEKIISLALAGEQNLKDRIHFAIALEREACAKVVEQAGIDGYGTIAAALLVRERGAP